MKILKFGGTSMGDADTWQRVLTIIDRYETPFIVVSATARTTRKLLAAANNAIENLSEAQNKAQDIQRRHQRLISNFTSTYSDNNSQVHKNCIRWIEKQIAELHQALVEINDAQELTLEQKDAILSIGERLSSYLFVQCGTIVSAPMKWVDATDIIRTDSEFGQANPDIDYIEQKALELKSLMSGGQIPVMGGFYGQDASERTTTLGFEGSDYTASLVGAALSADAIEIWTDVSGIYTCDPRLIEDAEPISQLSFQEATELAYFGAKVLHPSTTKPASEQQIPIGVKNIFEPDEPGTFISHETKEAEGVKAMTFKEECVVITVTSSNTVMGYEFLANVFDILRWHHLPVDVVTTTEASVSIAIENGKRIDEAIEQLQSYGSVELESKQGIISLVGCTTKSTQSLIKRVVNSINSTSMHMISFSQAKGNLNIVLPTEHIRSSVKKIHQQLF
ncbi:aspartate kinase [Fodinibius halophilus]|uniref:Aspartokinase n=1 Tax=Fodinibius halophilus TaxID=1736908 RepID=A0A6M1TG89_9BACT|nr:aspartate kinase [Fodinibius halophilus]NGP89814.1 aspartate kinase [Fodinibius halophilus]